MFNIDTGVKQEALNFATLMNALNMTEHRLEPLFNELGNRVALDTPIDDPEACKIYADFFNVDKKVLLDTYKIARKAFSELRRGDEIIKRGSIDYPPLLAQTEQAPRFLYIRGRKSLLHEKRTVALVGSRQASESAKEDTMQLAAALGENGITVVSGLARGIDASAYIAALHHGFNTIAVIGTNLNQYYPSENKDVQEEIEKKGLIVSQFPPSSKTQRWFFPLRNGVISGLSLATVIMEAGETSGALKTADFALKQNRQIIIPKKVMESGKISWPQKYVHKGAEVMEKPMDVLKILAENQALNRAKPEQQTLEEYIWEADSGEKEDVPVGWLEPVLIHLSWTARAGNDSTVI